jgi:hypothetical protein
VEPTNEAPNQQDDADVFGLRALRDHLGFVLRAPRRHPVIAVATFLAVAGLVVGSVLAIPHRYQVQASLLAQRNPILGTLTNPGVVRERDWDAPTRAAREVVVRREHLVSFARSTRVLERYLEHRAPAIRARDWLVQRVTGKPRDLERLFDDLVDTLGDRLWITVSPEGAVIVTVEWTDREVARDLVEAAVQTFLDERYASEIQAVGETIGILRTHDARVERDIAATLADVEAKERALGIRSLPASPPARPPRAVLPRPGLDEVTPKLQAQLAARQRALSDLESFRSQRLAEAQTQLARDRTVYAPAHPSLIASQHAVDSLSQPTPQVAELRAEAERLEAQLAARGSAPVDLAGGPTAGGGPNGELADVRLRLLSTDDPRLAFDRRRLEDLVRQHSNLLDRIDAAAVEMDTARAAFKYRYSMIAPPRVPKQPAKPYALLAIVGALVGGVAMAFFACAATDLRSGCVLEDWQLERSLGIRVLGELRG